MPKSNQTILLADADDGMGRRDPPPTLATQPTCRQRPSSTTTEPYSLALEITHACKLRHKLCDAGDGRFIENIWGVGYRLIAPSQRLEDQSAA